MARSTYHHGSLRQKLLSTAIALIRRAGANGFTLREVARRAGVSHNAPYRHFPSKEHLLAEIAAEGFRRLTEAQMRATAIDGSSLDRLLAGGDAYVDFAIRHPEHFRVMFEVDLERTDHPGARTAGEQAFGGLVALVEACQRDGQMRSGDPTQLARVAWSLSHGVAMLALARRYSFTTEAEILDFRRFAVRTLVEGLLSRHPSPDRDA